MARSGGFARRMLSEVEARTGVTVTTTDHLDLMEAQSRALGETRRELDLLGWQVLDYVSGNPQELSPQARRKWVQQARMVWRQDPQAGAAVDLLNDFTFGRGVPKPRAKDEEVQKVLDEFWDDPDNKLVLTSTEAQMALGTDLTLQCNLFILLFEGDDGKLKLGLLNHDEVQTVVRDEDNRLRVLYYVAAHVKRKWNYRTDSVDVDPTSQPRATYYKHWRYADDEDEQTGDDGPPSDRLGDGLVYHIAINRTSEEVFGNPSMRRLIRWFCHDDQTETLTADGWLKLDEIKRRLQAGSMPYVAAMDKATGVMAFQPPEKLTVYPCDNDELVRYKGYGVDMLVTPNHGMLSRDSAYDAWSVLAAEDAASLRPYVPVSAASDNRARVDQFTLPGTLKRARSSGSPNAWRTRRAAETHAAIHVKASEGMSRTEIAEAVGCSTSLVRLVVSGKIADVPRRPKGEWEALSFSMDKWLAYLGWYVAEGHGNGYICQSATSPRLAKMREAMMGLGIAVKEERNGNGQVILKPAERPKQFGEWLKTHVGEGALVKRLPGFVFDLPASQQRHLLDGLMGGDGTPTNWRDKDAGRYYTSSPGLADDVQRLLTLMGYRTRKSYVKRDNGYTVSFSRREAIRLPKATTEHYSGEVYCFTMPSGTTVTRRNGVVGISGNSAYNDFLSARVDMMQAAAAFIMKRKIKGTPNQVAKTAAKAISRRSELAGATGTGDMPAQTPPRPGSIVTENENMSFEPMKLASGAGDAAADAQMIRASISAGTRFPQAYLGDPSASNLATATSLELPVLKAVESRQEVFESVIRFVLDRAIERAVDSGRLSRTIQAEGEPTELGGPDDTGMYGPPAASVQEARSLREYEGQGDDESETERDLSYELSMPNPLKRMLGDLTSAISSIASTFDPNGTNVELSRALLTIALGEGLEVQDPAALVKLIFPEGYEDPMIVAARQQQQQPPQQPQGGEGPGIGAGGQPGRAAPGTSQEYQANQGQVQEAWTTGRDGKRVHWRDGLVEGRYHDLPAAQRNAREEGIDVTERIFDEEMELAATRLGRWTANNNGKI